MSKIKAIFFDLDHTLLNSMKAEQEAIHGFIKLFQELNKIDE